MIRFGMPLFLLFLPLLGVLLVLGRRRLREILLPCLAVLLLLLAIAAPQVRREERAENVYVLLDRSPSVAAATAEGEVEDALSALRTANPGQHFGTIAFASRATVVEPLSEEPRPGLALSPTTFGRRTDLARAVALALAALPEGGANQIVLASDGRITDGLLEAVSAARAAGVPISALPLGRAVERDAALARLEAPARVELGRPFQVVASVESSAAGEAILALYRDGDLLSSTPVALERGLTRFQIPDTLTAAGAHAYRAVVKRAGDPVPENDALGAFVETEDQPSLLVVSPESASPFVELLSAAGKAYGTSPVVPALEDLADYRQVLLTGLPLGSLAPRDIETLRTFVEDLGGGLLVAEGEEELRGFRGGGIEDLLPTTYTLPQRAEQASLAVVYLLDRSASMRGHAEGAVKIDVVKEAAAASVSLLDPDSLAGVIAFDRNFRWLRPLAPVADGREIYEALRGVEASGGTDIYYPTVEALDALAQVSARVKHILVLSDGKTVDEVRDWDGLFARMQQETDVHLSAIAIGPQPNLPLLNRLAEAGRGTVYPAANFSTLPQVAMAATQRLSRSRFVTGETPIVGPLAEGELADLPALQGYALTYPRPTTEILLWAGKDPILARWRVGLGRVGVLNTDLAGAWSAPWLSWSRAPLLLEAILGTVEAETAVAQGLAPSVEVGEEGVHVRVEAREPDGAFADFLDLEAVLLPGGAAAPLEQTSVGLYEATFPTLPEGGYALRTIDHTRGRVALVPFSVPYPAEYRRTGVDETTLRAIARATGGRLLVDEVLPEPRAAGADLSYVPVHRQVLLASLALFLLELVRRKLPRRRGAQATRAD